MKKSFLEIIRCPLCKSDFDIHADVEREDDIIQGNLICIGCGEKFPIDNSIPNLLPPELRSK
ncbi:MAG: methytransferase partner Trm112 [Chloroflexota bacterium]|nr:methytransferase partner Trm112 [Chloroflexota bacterium]